MRHILLNMKSFFKNDKLIFVIMLACVVSSAFVLNFSYGLYYNYDMKKNEEEAELKELYAMINEGMVLKKGDFKSYLESLDGSILDSMSVIWASGPLDELEEFSDKGVGPLYMRFVIHNGEYGVSEVTREVYETQEILTSGRYISDMEEADGEYVALAYGYEDKWGEACESLRNGEGGITLFGRDYQVIGTYESFGGTPVVPFLTVPDDFEITMLGFNFERTITRTVYDELEKTAAVKLPGVLSFPDIPLPDADSLAVYNNMIAAAFIISVLSLVNFAMLYHFVIMKRQKSLAIMRICGCRKSRAVLVYLGECLLLTAPAYIAGTALNMMLAKKVLGNVFEYIREAYTPQVCAMLAAVYFISFIIILSAMISVSVNRIIAESMAGSSR